MRIGLLILDALLLKILSCRTKIVATLRASLRRVGGITQEQCVSTFQVYGF